MGNTRKQRMITVISEALDYKTCDRCGGDGRIVTTYGATHAQWMCMECRYRWTTRGEYNSEAGRYENEKDRKSIVQQELI